MSFHPLGAAGATLLVALAGAIVPPADRTAPSPRPVVLMLPGRGYLAQDTAALRLDWHDALERGIASIGVPTAIDEVDFHLVWYADALDPVVPAKCETEQAGDQAPRPGEELAALLATGLTAAALVADWFEQLDGALLRAVAGDLLYFGDAGKRCAAEDRLANALEQAANAGRPVVLIAHSFGSLVAHGHLSTRTAPEAAPVERWITIGSLVGRPELRELLLGSDGRATGLPPGVGSWVNVRDPRDALAAPLLGMRSDSLTTAGVVDRVTESTPVGDPHDPARYLSDPVTARAIVEGWCGRSLAAAAPGCPTSP